MPPAQGTHTCNNLNIMDAKSLLLQFMYSCIDLVRLTTVNNIIRQYYKHDRTIAPLSVGYVYHVPACI